MHIAIISPADPKELSKYLYNPEEVKEILCMASSVHSLIKGFIQAGHKVTVITSTAGKENCIRKYQGDSLNIYVVENEFGKGWFGLRVYSRIRKLISEHLAEFDILHAHWTYLYAYSIIPFVKDIPCFCSVRDWCPYQFRLQKSKYRKFSWIIKYFYFRKVMNEYRMIKISNSSYTEQKVNSWKKGCPKSEFIPNSINERLIINKRKYPVGNPVFISVSSNLLETRKNIHNLLAAFQKFQSSCTNSKLVLVGKGNKSDFENRFADASFFDHVEFCGPKSHGEVIDLIDKSTVLIHPSVEETFGNIFLEASARCVPCIGGYNSGAVPQVLDYGRAGCLCDVSNPDSICDAMEQLTYNEKYYDMIVDNSQVRVNNMYSSGKVCEQHIELFKKWVEH